MSRVQKGHTEQAAVTGLIVTISTTFQLTLSWVLAGQIMYVLWLIAVSPGGQLHPLLCVQHTATSRKGIYKCAHSTHCASKAVCPECV